MAAGGEALEPKSPMEKNLIVENEANSRGKFTVYQKGISTIDTFHYKTILYFLSFIVRMIEKLVVKFLKKKEKINKVIFYTIFVHNRIHFVLLNIFISGGVFLNTRTILHMKTIPGTWLLLIDKKIAILCFFFYCFDICEMYVTSIIPVREGVKDHNDD